MWAGFGLLAFGCGLHMGFHVELPEAAAKNVRPPTCNAAGLGWFGRHEPEILAFRAPDRTARDLSLQAARTFAEVCSEASMLWPWQHKLLHACFVQISLHVFSR